ncbi:MAG: AgmX/PglI C-terminal domain-containing protein [Myxococcales bacterium]|nr:AgmX/PglI C-terminal domain-containing protein [Myxococcales bacterium]
MKEIAVNTRLVGYAVVGLAVGCQSGNGRSGAPEQKPPKDSPPIVEMAPITAMFVPTTPQAREAAPPWTLTASDGSGLQITRVDAKAIVQGPLAFTELHLYFHNPEARVREGTFAITLPSGAAVSRFAMELDGQMQEAEVVEKGLARRVYDDFLHRRQDPALLEKGAGNQFTAKVFPIPAKGDKHLVISFSQELVGKPYTLPLRGLPKIERVDATIGVMQLDGSSVDQGLSERNWRPDRDFVATTPGVGVAVTAGNLVVQAFTPSPEVLEFGPPQPPKRVTLLVDTSASRALGFQGYVASIHRLVSALRERYGDPLSLQVIAFDQDSQRIFDGLAANYGDAQDAKILARGAAGASNLAQALTALGSGSPPHERLVVVTDGVITAGPDTSELVATLKQLPVQRVDVVLAGGIRDEHAAAAIARAGLPQPGDVFDLDAGAAGVAIGLGEPVLVDLPIEVAGASWVYPRRIAAVRPGSTVMIYARVKSPATGFGVAINGKARPVAPTQVPSALIERAVAGAEIEELEAQLDATSAPNAKQALREDIARRSVRSRVISSQASMIVLETEADYARYGIARTSLADILVIGAKGIEQSKRTAIIATKAPPVDRTPALMREQAIQLARTAGVLGEASLDGGDATGGDATGGNADAGAFASLTNTGDISSGFEDSNMYGGLLGNEAGEANGGFGFGRSGFGPGGGGVGEGTIGLGQYGTIGHGSGTGEGYGAGGSGRRGRMAALPTVSVGQPEAQGNLNKAIIRRYIKRNIQKIQYCYERELLAKPNLTGMVRSQFLIGETGAVSSATATGVDPNVASCVAGVIKDIEFPKPSSGVVQVNYPFTFRGPGDSSSPPRAWSPPRVPGDPNWGAAPSEPSTTPKERSQDPLTGKLSQVMRSLKLGDTRGALQLAQAWHAEAPGDVLALIALGEALEARHDLVQAARIYGSIIDLFATRADFRRFAGERLERIGSAARALVIDTYRRAVADRPDHVTGHRLLAYALVRGGDYAGGFAAILAGLDQQYPGDRFRGAERVLREDAGLIGAAYLAHGGSRDEVTAQLSKHSAELATGPSTRFILYWETDANDVDFHIKDAKGGHAWYSNMHLPSGGDLYADVTTGYGPECFAIPGTPAAGPYELSINYFSQGPMGYGMGLLQVLRFDGTGFTFDDRPYVIMVNQAFVELGSVP